MVAAYKLQNPEVTMAPRLALFVAAVCLSVTTSVFAQTYSLAEGATGTFFDYDLAISNPNTVSVPTTITFLKEDGSTAAVSFSIAAGARQTFRVDNISGLSSTGVSAIVQPTNGLPLLVERTMFADSRYYMGHGGNAVEAARTKWYFAEGSQGFFDTYLLLANSGSSAASATVTFLIEGGSPVVRGYTVNATSRVSIHAGSIPELSGKSFSIVVDASAPIIAERAMYFGASPFWTGGHESAGVPEAATSWFHPEGATGAFFDTFILVGNPNGSPATLTVTFLLTSGAPITKTYTVAANGRLTIEVESQHPMLANAAVSTTVTSNIPVISERAMYWAGSFASWFEAHNSFGVTQAGTKWGLAEGRVGGTLNFQTYILIANATSSAANVQITYLRTRGQPVAKTYTIPAATRFNVAVNSVVPELANESFGAVIESTNGVPIAVERAMYWDALGVTWAGGTNATATLLPASLQTASPATPQSQSAPPVITNVSPTAGPVEGGTVLKLTGTGFVPGAHVEIDGSHVSTVSVVDSATVTLVAPAHQAGIVNVVVINPDGQRSLARSFVYGTPPAPDTPTEIRMCATEAPPSPFRTLAAGSFECKWQNRTSLTVRFLDGDPVVQSKVRAIAQEWAPHTGIALNFVSSGDADIRISFVQFNPDGKRAGTWSKLGTCNAPLPGAPTMNYSWLTPWTEDIEYRRVVLHEFGHALGLVHEHQSPAAGIRWNVAKVLAWCQDTQGWGETACRRNVLEVKNQTNYTEFDRASVMIYGISAALTLDGFSVERNTELSFLDKTFMKTWYTIGPWTNWSRYEDEYLVGNWDAGSWGGYKGTKIAVRRDQYVLMSLNYDGIHDFVQGYGLGNSETQYLTGDWDGDGKDNLAVRRGSCVYMDFNFDGAHDRVQCYGNGASEDQYLVGDWDGDGKDNLAVRRGNCVLMDFDFDGIHNFEQCYGNGASEDQYLVGDWDGDGRDNLAVRRGNCVNMDFDFNGSHNFQQCYGNGASEDQYLVGDWDGDGRDNLAVRRGNCFNLDYNFDGSHDLTQCYGNGIAPKSPL
jgi:hypothetical protein